MALDESRDGDEIFKEDGITFLINKELYELVYGEPYVEAAEN